MAESRILDVADVRLAIMRHIRIVHIVRGAISAFLRIVFVLLILAALAPLFEVAGLFSVADVAGNFGDTESVLGSFDFMITAVANSELIVRIFTFSAILCCFGIIGRFFWITTAAFSRKTLYRV